MKLELFLIVGLCVCINTVTSLNENIEEECNERFGYYWDSYLESCLEIEARTTEEETEEPWPSPPTTPSTTPLPPPTPPPGPGPACPLQCLFGGVYRFPHFSNCNRFLECFNGFIFDLPCAAGQVFDIATVQCMENGRCVLDR